MKKREQLPTLRSLADEYLDDTYRFMTCDWSGVSIFKTCPRWSERQKRWKASPQDWKLLRIPPSKIDLSEYWYHGKVVYRRCIEKHSADVIAEMYGKVKS